MKKQYYCVDLLKFLLAYLVVAIHIEPLASFGSLPNYALTHYLCRIAVPFYFMASGFFLYGKMNENSFDGNGVKKYILKILKLYIIWTLIYFPIVLNTRILPEENASKAFLLWLKDVAFSGSYAQLWYLHATMVAAFVIAFFVKRKATLKRVIVFGGVLYLIGLIPQTYSFVLNFIKPFGGLWSALKGVGFLIKTTRNGLFEGVLFMSLGMLLAKNPAMLSSKKAAAGFGISLVLMFLEAIFVKFAGWARETDLYIFLVPLSFCLFALAINTELRESRVYKNLRTLGMLVFYLHMLIKPLAEYITKIIAVNHSVVKYLLVAVITTAVSLVIMLLSNKKGFKWLKKLYQ